MHTRQGMRGAPYLCVQHDCKQAPAQVRATERLGKAVQNNLTLGWQACGQVQAQASGGSCKDREPLCTSLMVRGRGAMAGPSAAYSSGCVGRPPRICLGRSCSSLRAAQVFWVRRQAAQDLLGPFLQLPEPPQRTASFLCRLPAVLSRVAPLLPD